MKIIFRTYIVVIWLLTSPQLFAQTPTLLKDINTTAIGVPSSPGRGLWMGTNYYFPANDGMNGIELWKSDGTAANTVLLKDIFAGNGSSSPNNFTLVGTTIFFTATDGANGVELWKTDGTTAGTSLVKDIRGGSQSASPSSLNRIGTTTVIFTANDGLTGGELWKSDGTAAGTVLVKDIFPGSTGGAIGRVAGTGTKIYFGASSTTGNNELWKSDGTTAGTVMVKDINPISNTGSLNGAVFAAGETLYFAADDGSNGLELWKSDGTSAGTVLVKDIYSGSTGAGNPQNFAVMGTKIYFTGFTAAGAELWVTDGTNAGTVLVKDINTTTSTASSQPTRLTAVGSTLFFRATDGVNGVELWKSDGTLAGTVMVKNINVNSALANSNPDQFTVIGSTLYFQANDSVAGVELWKTNGTAAGTVIVKDILNGSAGSAPNNVVLNPIGTSFLFSADNGTNGAEIFKSDGTAAGTLLVKNINPDNGNSAIANLTALGSKVVFTANDGLNGTEIWSTDGTVAGTILLKDINTVAGASSSPARLTAIGSNVYFSANAGATVTGTELYKTDGTIAGTSLVKDINLGTGNSNPQNFIAHNGVAYFQGNDGTSGSELWKTDGTAANTVLVKDVVAGSGNSIVGGSSATGVHAVSTGTILFFQALDQLNNIGYELFSSTGAVGNGGLVKDINSTAAGNNSAPNNFVYLGVGNTVYFAATTDAEGQELWKSDNTAAGTVLVRDITPGAESNAFSRFLRLGNKFFFVTSDATNGSELWQSDGTNAGTSMLKNINPGLASSDPQNLTVCGNFIYFSADDGTNGRELWRTDGTLAGTIMVTNIVAGSGSSNPANFIYHGALNSVFFSAYTPTNGVELWVYDGTASRLYTEVVPGAGNSNPGPIMLAGNNLVFVGTNGTNGLELYSVDAYNTWTGASSTAFTTSGNWKNGVVPATGESVLFPSSGVINEPTVSAARTVDRLEIEPSRTLTLGAALTVSDMVFNRGTIKGTGSLIMSSNTFVNSGTIAPGNSPGIFTVTGNFTNQSSGILQIEVGGTTAGTGYDRLVVNGAVTLGGTLVVTKVPGFSFAAGQQFTIITGSSVTGSFSTVTLPFNITGTVNTVGNNVILSIAQALPLSLLDFTVRSAGKTSLLNWATGSEQNSSYFDVERSTDGSKFSKIAAVPAVGRGNNNYRYVDGLPFSGINYYRLRMVDIDGTFTYSRIMSTKFEKNESILVAPVPATNYVLILVNEQSIIGQQAFVYDMMGKVIKKIVLTANTRIDISQWPVGEYAIKTVFGTHRFTKE